MTQKQAAFRVSKELSLIFIVCKLHLNLYIYLKKRVGIHSRLKFASLQAASLLHIRAQVNIESAFFTLKSIFIIKKNVFLYAKEHALIFFCRYLWWNRKSPYESKYVPSKDLQERKLKWYNIIPKNKERRRTLLDCYLIHYMTLKRSHLQILKPSSMEKVTLGADLYSLWFNRVFVKQK